MFSDVYRRLLLSRFRSSFVAFAPDNGSGSHSWQAKTTELLQWIACKLQDVEPPKKLVGGAYSALPRWFLLGFSFSLWILHLGSAFRSFPVPKWCSGIYVAENRAAIAAEAGTRHSKVVNKLSGEKWKKLTEAEKKPYKACVCSWERLQLLYDSFLLFWLQR